MEINSNTKRVLIIDDNVSYRAILAETLSCYDVYSARSGEEGVEKAHLKPPDIIILDIVMDGMDGYDVCALFRRNEDTRTTPIIFFSSLNTLEGRLKAYDFGGNDYIAKNTPPAEIKAKVKSMLNSTPERIAIKKEIRESSSLLYNLQVETSQLQIVSKFTQAAMYTKDLEQLSDVLFNCLWQLNARAVIYYRKADKIYSSCESVTRLEDGIVKTSSAFGKIHSFGAGRAIFNWSSSVMLVKDIGDMLDTIAHIMDGVECAIRVMSLHDEIATQLDAADKQTNCFRKNLQELSSTANQDQLSNAAQSNANGEHSEFESTINDPAHTFFENFLDRNEKNTESIRELIRKLHTPPDRLNEFFIKKKDPGDNSSDPNFLF